MENSSYNSTTYLRRFVAYIVDFFLCLMLFWLYVILFCREIGLRKYQCNGVPSMLILVLIMFLYYSIQEFFWQRTLGKYLLRLKVVKLDNSQLTFLDIIKRHFFDFIELLFFPALPLFIAIFNKRQQRLGDIIAKTRVK